MLSRQTRIAVLTAQASRKYGPAILETAASLEELIKLVKSLDRLPKRTAWPKKVLIYLAEQQHGICPECNKSLPPLSKRPRTLITSCRSHKAARIRLRTYDLCMLDAICQKATNVTSMMSLLTCGLVCSTFAVRRTRGAPDFVTAGFILLIWTGNIEAVRFATA
jgi:hypothetical protein